MPTVPRIGRPVLAALAVLAGLASSTSAQIAQTSVDGVDLYETEVRPLLEAHCLKCHGANPERLRGGLSLTSRRGVLAGGDHGPALDAAEPARSLLLRAVGYEDDQLQMPPTGRLSDAQVDTLRQWINLGAPFGGEEDQLAIEAAEEVVYELTDDDRAWWSVGPLERPEPPASPAADRWALNDIDRFVMAGLVNANLEPAAAADRRALIRRATYDLTGLPPTPEEVRAFIADDAPDAYARLIDRLLASPQYGVKWGRHWLDLVRFAETDSYERDRLKPGAWRYRDWVIDAFNADMPYDEFLVTQLAGDEIEHPTAASIIATGYLRLGIWDDEPTDTLIAQYDDLDSILDTTSRVMLGMSMGCARCHDHKGDPIPQRDYYAMLAFFRGIAPYKVGGGNATTPANFVDRIPADLGAADAGNAQVAWQAEREALLAEVRSIIDRAHAAAGEAALFAAIEARDEHLVAHLAFEEGVPLVAADGRGANHGRIEHVTTGVEGVVGNAFRFNGHRDSVRIARPVEDDFTLSIWFRTEATAPGGSDVRWFRGAGLIDGEIGGVVDDFGLSIVGDGYIAAGTGRPERFVNSGPGYNDGAWHHAAFTRERVSGRIALYVDGALVAETHGSKNALTSPAFLDIGRMQPGHGHFEGDLDEVRIYGTALDERDVLDLYLQGGASGHFNDVLARHAPDLVGPHRDVVQRLASLNRPQRELIEVLRVKEFGPEAPETHVLIRGNPHAPSAMVEPAIPMLFDEANPVLEVTPTEKTSGRRLALAKWIASPENGRTARVMANRLWQFHFGRGLSTLPNDFGHFGIEPTHPELLDWLAAELIERDWSLKSMHRLLMSSRTYRMASTGAEEALASDPENSKLWRFDMRRLTAEEIRDSILAANGTLNLQMGGPGVYPPMPEEILATASRPGAAWGRSSPEQSARRSVYIHVKRSLLTPLLTTFDLADTDATCPVRFTTTQPTQALTMLNSDFTNEQARIFARRLRSEVGDDLAARVTRGLELVTCRSPSSQEVVEGVSLVEELMTEEGYDPDSAFANYCLVLLNLNEFVYLD